MEKTAGIKPYGSVLESHRQDDWLVTAVRLQAV